MRRIGEPHHGTARWPWALAFVAEPDASRQTLPSASAKMELERRIAFDARLAGWPDRILCEDLMAAVLESFALGNVVVRLTKSGGPEAA